MQIMLAAAMIAALAAPPPTVTTEPVPQPSPQPRRTLDLPSPEVVVVLAHPDDELVFAPALSVMAREGLSIHLIFATDGDQGPGVSGMAPGADLAMKRRMEGFCSGMALRVDIVGPLALGDGTLGLRANDPQSAANRLAERLKPYLADAVTVITWGPDGGYGHADHRMVSAVVTQLVQAMPAEKRPRLLYPALINTPLPEPLASQGWAITAPDLATVRYRYTAADLAAANKAAQCHRTQFDDATRAMIVPGFDAAVWKGEVAFRLAF